MQNFHLAFYQKSLPIFSKSGDFASLADGNSTINCVRPKKKVIPPGGWQIFIRFSSNSRGKRWTWAQPFGNRTPYYQHTPNAFSENEPISSPEKKCINQLLQNLLPEGERSDLGVTGVVPLPCSWVAYDASDRCSSLQTRTFPPLDC